MADDTAVAEERKPWERLPDENARWFARFEAFRLAGPGRSFLGAYNGMGDQKGPKGSDSLPRTWRAAAIRFDWRARAEAWDAHVQRIAAEQAEAERITALTTGFALQHRRVRALDKLARLLLDEVDDDEKRWTPDVKQVGGERVDITRFNAGLVEQARKTLDDLATELGERVRKSEHTGKDGGPIQVAATVTIFIPDNGRPASGEAVDAEGGDHA